MKYLLALFLVGCAVEKTPVGPPESLPEKLDLDTVCEAPTCYPDLRPESPTLRKEVISMCSLAPYMIEAYKYMYGSFGIPWIWPC